jgi:hypothetical protein
MLTMSSRKRSQNLNDWEKRRDQQVQESIQYWQWERVFRAWKEWLSDFSVVIDPLFHKVSVHDPKNPTGRSRHCHDGPPVTIEQFPEASRRLASEEN